MEGGWRKRDEEKKWVRERGKGTGSWVRWAEVVEGEEVFSKEKGENQTEAMDNDLDRTDPSVPLISFQLRRPHCCLRMFPASDLQPLCSVRCSWRGRSPAGVVSAGSRAGPRHGIH